MSKVKANKHRSLKSILSVSCLTLALCFQSSTRADTTAVTPAGLDFSGFVNGAVGFSFTPTTNLAVTQVGYLDNGATAPIIKFWSDTNYVFASFNLAPGSGGNVMVYSNVTLTLFAGQRYSVTVQDGTSSPITFNGHTTFQVATQLSDYAGKIVLTNNFNNYGSGYYFQGPDFKFTNQVASVTIPDLSITQASQTNAIVLWPASPAGFILQQIASLDSTNWMNTTNTISTAGGTNQISDFTISNRFYRLYHP
jgi:hypothetical protein